MIRMLLNEERVNSVSNVDCLTYAANQENLVDVHNREDYRFYENSINEKEKIREIIRNDEIGCIIHLAAESHVDNSIDSMGVFVKTNIDGTRKLLEVAVEEGMIGGNISFVHVSTDEVYGELLIDQAPFTENSKINPRNPYSVTKAASDMFVNSFVNTYGINACITRCSNNYGPNQHREKLIPKMIERIMKGEKLPIYGDGSQIRDWIFVEDHARGLISVMWKLIDREIDSGEIFNFGSSNEIKNIELVSELISIIGGSSNQIQFVEDRPGHDKRYAIDSSKSQSILDWSPMVSWKEGLSKTIEWHKVAR